MSCKYKSCMTKKKAFTLIELLIVIAIIGILFIVLVSKVDFATDKAKASGVQTDFRSFQVALEAVSKENAGFNTFGWDTGDNGGGVANGDVLTLNDQAYTYTNATKDAGDRIRNSYDEGDTNLNGTYDDGEVWTGRKIYTENWTGCYTIINPGNASDMSAIFDLETAINKNLDPKLHIVIADDGTISMANGYKDPWSTQYHGQYITNASADAAAKWNTDASMAGSTGDNMDRGAILIYSNGANQKFGTKVKIVGGVVTATVSQIDANTPDNNKMGTDDYVLAVVYSYTNGYGETMAATWGFSNNQMFSTGYNAGESIGEIITPAPAIAPGLYESGSNYEIMISNWETLKLNNVIHVANGVVKTNYDGSTNSSRSLLCGDLVLSTEVTSLDTQSFYNCDGITSILIPNTVTSIGNLSFVGCLSLTNVDIPDSVTNLGTSAFTMCKGLKTASIGKGVTTLGDTTFYGCEQLENVIIGKNVTSIGKNAFGGCMALDSITIPKNVTLLDHFAFYYALLNNIYFEGTADEWNNITIQSQVFTNASATYVQCTDGQRVPLN